MMKPTASTNAEIDRLLKEHYEFGECILEDVRWRHRGATLDLVFDYVWQGQAQFDSANSRRINYGNIRADLNRAELKVVRFHVVQEFHIRNALNDLACENIYELGEGFSEVAALRLADDDQLVASYRSLAVPAHHVICWWEGNRRIDIVFSEMEVIDSR
jgi:hypothetical protein